MSAEYKRNLGVSISSTNVPTMQMSEDTLSFSFLNWDNEFIELEFAGTLSFRWNDLPCSDGLADDVAYEVFNSEWIENLSYSDDTEQNTRTHIHHYQFCVYGCGLFEVVAEGLRLTRQEPEVIHESWDKCAL